MNQKEQLFLFLLDNGPSTAAHIASFSNITSKEFVGLSRDMVMEGVLDTHRDSPSKSVIYSLSSQGFVIAKQIKRAQSADGEVVKPRRPDMFTKWDGIQHTNHRNNGNKHILSSGMRC